MQVLKRDWHNVARGDQFRIVPLGDTHLGNAASDEKALTAVVADVAADDSAYWIGMADYCEFINRTDPRFSPTSLARWITVADLVDLASAQRDRFLDITEPIAGKCLGLLEGNHERAIRRHYERNIYLEIVAGIKQRGGFPAEHHLALGYTGWLLLRFYRSEVNRRQSTIKINLHHGFIGGKLAGAKALNMQRWLWTHDADLVLFGHSHNSAAQVETVEAVRGSRIEHQNRIGAFTGTFMSGAEYAQERGYFPTPQSRVEIILRPGAAEWRDRIRVISGF